MMTGDPGLFAGGDMVPSERTVTIGVGHGKKAARNIDAYLRGEAYAKPAEEGRSPPSTSCTSGSTPTSSNGRRGTSTCNAGRTSFDEVVRA